MLETVREFGLEQLAAAGEEATTRDRHAAWCLAFAGEAPAALSPIYRPDTLDRLEAEHPNLRAALAWLDETGRLDQLLPLADQLGWFWYLAGHYREGLTWLERALAISDDNVPARARCEALSRVGHLAQTLNEPRAASYLEQALALARTIGYVAYEAEASVLLGIMAEDRGDYAAAEEHLATGRRLNRAGGQHLGADRGRLPSGHRRVRPRRLAAGNSPPRGGTRWRLRRSTIRSSPPGAQAILHSSPARRTNRGALPACSVSISRPIRQAG